MKREIAKSRPESRPRPRQRRDFFWDSCSNLEIDENFQISHKLGLGLAAKISQAFEIQLDRYRGQYTIITITIQIIPSLVCFPGFHALLATHVVTIWWIWWGEKSPHPLSPAPPHPPHPPPHFPPPPISWCVVCLCVVHAESLLGIERPIGGERSDVSTLHSYVVWRHAGTAASCNCDLPYRPGQQWIDPQQCCQVAEILAKKLKRGRRKKKFVAEFWLVLPKTGRKGAAENFQKKFLIFSCDNHV